MKVVVYVISSTPGSSEMSCMGALAPLGAWVGGSASWLGGVGGLRRLEGLKDLAFIGTAAMLVPGSAVGPAKTRQAFCT